MSRINITDESLYKFIPKMVANFPLDTLLGVQVLDSTSQVVTYGPDSSLVGLDILACIHVHVRKYTHMHNICAYILY